MKKFLKFFMCLCLLTIFAPPFFSVEASINKSMDDDMTDIRDAITDEDVCRWSGRQDTVIDYSYMLPVYLTMDISESSSTLESTLQFANRYIAPVVDEDKNCCGMLSFYLLKGENWVIGRYTTGVDFVSAFEQYGVLDEDKNVYFIEIPQLGGDFGFLSVLGDKEQYVSIASKTAVINADTEDIIGKIKNATYSSGTESDGSGSAAKVVKYYGVTMSAILLCAVGLTICFIKKNNKHV